MIDVGRAEDRDALPRDREHGSLVARVEQAHGLGERHAVVPEREMAPADLAELPLFAELTTELVGPRARRADDDLRLHLERSRTSRRDVLHDDAADATILGTEKLLGAGVVDGSAALANRFTEHAQDETRVVRLRVEVSIAAPSRPSHRAAECA